MHALGAANIPTKSPIANWTPVCLWTIIIYATLPYGSKIIGWCKGHINRLFGTEQGYVYIGWFAAALVAVFLLGYIFRFLRNRRIRSAGRGAVMLLVLAAYAYPLCTLRVPPEKIHFIEYGYLAVLLVRAWKAHLNSSALWPVSFFSGAFIGALDEFIQHVHPDRSGEFADVLLNIAGVGLPMMLVALADEHPPRPSPTARDLGFIRMTGGLLGVVIAVFLYDAPEYGGVSVNDPLGIRFKTRAGSLEELVKGGESVPPEARAEFDAETPFTYSRFDTKYSSKDHCFLNEMRVHLFRRDRYAGQYAHELASAGETIDSAHPLAPIARMRAGDEMKAWLAKRLGSSPEKSDTFLAEFRSWVRGDSASWGRDLMEEYSRSLAVKKKAPILERIFQPRDEAGRESRRLANLRIAERENVILERYYGGAFNTSPHVWPSALKEEIRVRLASEAKPEAYESPVAEAVVTEYSRFFALVVTASLVLMILVRPGAFAQLSPGTLGTFAGIALWILLLHPMYFSGPVAPSAEILARGQPPVLRLPRAVGIIADGIIDRGEWPGEAILLADNGTAAAAWPRTKVHAAADDRSLYVAFICTDTSLAATLKGRDADYWREDAVEVFIDTEGAGRRYVEIEVSPAGGLYDGLVEWSRSIDFATARSWQSRGVRVASLTGATGWVVELDIPFEEIGILPGAHRSIRANFCRIDTDTTAPPVYRYQAWAPTRAWFHAPAQFGWLLLE